MSAENRDALYVHVAEDGGIFVIRGGGDEAAWLRMEELAAAVAEIRETESGAIFLSSDLPIDRPSTGPSWAPVELIKESGVPIFAASKVHPATVREGGATALMAASYQNQGDAVRDLLERGAEIEAKDQDGQTALMYAANAGARDAVAILLAHGANGNTTDAGGSTPLMFAAQRGDHRIVKALLDAGAVAETRGGHGFAALDFAEQNGHHRAAAVLRMHDAVS